MSYTTPPTWVSGGTVAASDLQIVSDDITDLDGRAKQIAFMGVSLLRSTSLSAASGSYQSVSWASAPIDVGGWWSSGSTITVPSGAIPAGYSTIIVEIHGHSRAAANNTGTRQLHWLLNGAEIEIGRSVSAINGETTELEELVWAEVAAGDTLVMEVKQNSGGSLAFLYSSAHIKRLGPLS